MRKKVKSMMSKRVHKKQNKNRNTVIIEDTIVTLSNLHPPAYVSLSQESYFEIFDWLSLEELHRFGLTCSHVQQVAGEYFQKNYAATRIIGLHDGILVEGKSLKMNGFSRFIRNISIKSRCNGTDSSDASKKLKYIASNCESLQRLELIDVPLDLRDVRWIRKVLSKIETLTMNETLIFSFHWEYFLKHCENLRSLSVILNSNCEHLWLLHRYPKLCHLELTSDINGFSIDELRSFFDQNPNIERFSTTATYFSCNRIAFKNAKFDELAIQIEDSYKINLKLLATILNDFYQHGIYKRLYLQILSEIAKKNLFYGFIQSLRALEVLCITNDDKKIMLPSLVNLKELIIFNECTIRVKDIKIIAAQFNGLECIQFYTIASNAILPFIQRSMKLRKIKVTKLERGTHLYGNILNIAELNAERKKMKGAQKINIFVDENIYLSTKWMASRTNFEFIELKRFDSDIGH